MLIVCPASIGCISAQRYVRFSLTYCMMCAGGTQQYYNVDPEPVWQPQPQYRSVIDSASSAGRHPSVNGARYADDGYGGDLDASGHFDVEPGFTQQQVNGANSVDVGEIFWRVGALSTEQLVRFWR